MRLLLKTTRKPPLLPVDKFEIVNGPGALKCMEIQEELHRHPDVYVEVTFTLKTLASDSSFKRQLKLANLYGVFDGNFSFTAIFNNRIVSGAYNMQSRTGWFNLD
ncbi:MAG TPA: hypothetical protein VIM37_03460 [Candidatus Microsaccharimonas sp.]|jgi:hypothetical protein